MKRLWWGFLPPAVFLGLLWGELLLWPPAPAMKYGIGLGLAIAFIQSFLSVAALAWALRKPCFYWVWMGGIFARGLVLAVTAFVVYRYPDIHFIATLISLVTATTFFLVVESATFVRSS